jgi:hypothetical protein
MLSLPLAAEAAEVRPARTASATKMDKKKPPRRKALATSLT